MDTELLDADVQRSQVAQLGDLASKQGRVFLTRDHKLAEQRGLSAVYLLACDDAKQQFQDILGRALLADLAACRTDVDPVPLRDQVRPCLFSYHHLQLHILLLALKFIYVCAGWIRKSCCHAVHSAILLPSDGLSRQKYRI